MPRASPNYRTEHIVIDRTHGHPMLYFLAAFPIACFTGALVTDIAYAGTTNVMWADFSDWLLAAGMLAGVLAAMLGVVILVTARRIRPQRPLLLVGGSLLVLILGLINNFVHSRDAWTSVMPAGLILSALTVIALLATTWLGAPTAIQGTVATEPALQEPRP